MASVLPSSIPPPEKSLNAAKGTSDCTAARGFYDFSWVVEFIVEEVTSHAWKPVKVCLLAEIFFLQMSPRKIAENLFPYGFGFSEDHGIGMLQGLVRQGGHMKSPQYDLGPLGPQTIGDAINVRYMVGESDN